MHRLTPAAVSAFGVDACLRQPLHATWLPVGGTPTV